MPRTSDIWWRESKGCFFTTIDGQQKRLCKTLKESRTKLQKILKGDHAGPADSGLTFARLADKFLDHSQATNECETYQVHVYFLQSFKDHVGKRLVSRLCEADLDEWCRKHATPSGKVNAGGRKGGLRDASAWSENTQARARAIVLASLNYGVKKLNLPPHPLKHVQPGTVGRRERLLTKEEREKVRAAVNGCFADYIFALEQTGARPFSEICKVTAGDVDLEKGTWTLAKWKNSRKKKGVKRTIYLTDAMLELTKRLMAEHSTGALFRNQIGKPWTRQALTARFRALGEKLGIEDLTAYCVRHGFCTDCLAKGMSVSIVAELMGTSIQTIQKAYNHLDQKHDVLREAAKMAVGA